MSDAKIAPYGIFANVFNNGLSFSDSEGAVLNEEPELQTPNPDNVSDEDILKHTMAAILYVEAKAAMAESNSDYANLNLATEEENAIYQEKLGELLDEFSDRFDENDFSPSNMPPVDVKVKEEYKNQIL